MARDTADVAKVLAYGRRTSIPVIFRAGGTSLNGQGQTDGILVDVRRHWRGVAVARRRRPRAGQARHGARPRQPRARPHGYKLGPDPASTDIACVGGVIANNSGGMRCGVTHDSYRTVSALTFVLASGHGDRHRRARRRAALRRGRARARRGAARDPRRDPRRHRAQRRGSGASSRSRTRPATGSAPSSTPRRRWRSSAACWSARRARWRSSPRPSSRPSRSRRGRPVSWLHFPGIERRSRRSTT